MKHKLKHLTEQTLFLSLLLLMGSCQKEEILEKQNFNFLNSFTMQVNRQSWEPSQVGEDKCMRTYNAAWAALIGNGVRKPYYTISASRDSKAAATSQSENVFRLRIFNVQETGAYPITGSYVEPFNSFAVFSVIKPDGTYVQYINKFDKPAFVVEVTEIIPIPGSAVTGIKGTFQGTLYNEINSLDSLTFSRGAFTFKKLNRNNYNQCAE